MDDEFTGSVSPEMAQVKAAAKAFFDSMELYMGAIQQLEDEMKRLQGEIDDLHQEGPQQQGGNLDDICEDLDPIECLQGLNIELTTEGSANWTDEQIQVVYDSIKAQYNAITAVGGNFNDFFPQIIIMLSDTSSDFAAMTEEVRPVVVRERGLSGEIRITIWNSGVYYWPSDMRDEKVNVFSPELITHEFGHALTYGWGENNLQNLFEVSIEGNPSIVETAGVVPVWEPFESGSLLLDPRVYGRMYGERGVLNEVVKGILAVQYPDKTQGEISDLWDTIQASDLEKTKTLRSQALKIVLDERVAEAYAVWVYDNYNRVNGVTINSIDAQIAFWNEIFGNQG